MHGDDAEDWRAVAVRVAARLAPHGLDLVHPFALGAVNDALAPAQRLPDHGRRDALGLLVGNTRALWAPFLAACRGDAARRASPDPVEGYCATHLAAAIADLDAATLVRWAHAVAPPLPIQRLAHLTGLAPLSPVGLNVHRRYGPWIALRALAVVDLAGPRDPPAPVASPCPDCVHTCMPLFERASAAQGGRDGIGDTWPLWLAVRDACPVGRAHRYCEDQIRYHYAGDRTVLM